MSKKYIIWLVLGFAIAGLIAYIARRPPQGMPLRTDRIKISASFYPLYFLAQEIGGEYADAAQITPAGAEPHDYEPTAQDRARMEQSALLILNGAGLEAWEDAIRETHDPERTHIVIAGEGLASRRMSEESKTIVDPHLWLDPLLTKQMADKVLLGFIAVDPAREPYYRLRADALAARLDALDAEYRTGLAPCREKNIITAHAAFGYLAAEYGLVQAPIAGLSPDEEPSARRMAEITQFAKARGIRHVFFERFASPRIAETLAREIGAQTLALNPLEGMSREELAQGRNYFTEMRANLANLKTALECAK